MKVFNHVGNWNLKELTTENVNGKRYYSVDSTKLPSITTVTGTFPEKVKGLKAWRKRVGNKEANKIQRKAAAKGTAVHNMIEKYLNNDLSLKFADPLAIESFRKVQPVLDNYIDDIFAQEVALWSSHLKVAGRVDCVGHFDGKPSIIDFKTSRKPKKREWIQDYFMQACGYAIMWEERTLVPIDSLVIIISPTEGNPQVFIDHRDNWTKPLLGQIEYFYQRVLERDNE